MSSAALATVLWICAIWGFASSDEDLDDGGMELLSVDVPSEHNSLRDEEIVEKQIEHDKTVFEQEADAERVDIDRLKGVRNSTYFTDRITPPENFGGYLRRIIKFQGGPADIFVYIILPVVFGQLFSLLLKQIIPRWLDEKKTITEYPLVPLVYFQQSAKEVRLKRSGRKTLGEISKHFIIRANETYIDLQEIRDAALTRQTLTRSPWALVRFMIRLQMIYANSAEQGQEGESRK